ncbi:hypothetical protein BH23ACI1_BH23ACI1_09630 [soil metagenome]|nr:hypothetical protein [Acidobacteriota bacterium]
MVRVSVVRFFLVVMPPPPWLLVGFVAVVALGGWTLALNPRNVDSAFTYILLLQMLSASSGFGAAASRGHLDPILVSGRSRASIALGSVLAAALPGLVAWAAILIMSVWVGGVAPGRAFTVHRFAALFIVSGCAWATGLVLPRLAGGALWMMGMIGLAMTHGVFTRFVVVLEGPSTFGQVLITAAACAACPLLFLGDNAGPRDLRVVTLALSLAASVVAIAVWRVSERDYTLKEPA